MTPIPDHSEGEEGAFSLAFLASVPALGWATYYVSVCRLTHWTDYEGERGKGKGKGRGWRRFWTSLDPRTHTPINH